MKYLITFTVLLVWVTQVYAGIFKDIEKSIKKVTKEVERSADRVKPIEDEAKQLQNEREYYDENVDRLGERVDSDAQKTIKDDGKSLINNSDENKAPRSKIDSVYEEEKNLYRGKLKTQVQRLEAVQAYMDKSDPEFKEIDGMLLELRKELSQWDTISP